jgi:hypothetical protein
MISPERPLADVGPLSLPEDLRSMMKALGEPYAATVSRAQANLAIAMEQDAEPLFWETVAYRAYLMDMLPREGRAITEGLERVERSGLPESERVPSRRTAEVARTLGTISNDLARRRIAQTMSHARVREGIVLRLLPDDVVASHSEHTRELFLETLRDAPRATGFAASVDATPTERRDGVILTAEHSRHRVFSPARWHETSELLDAVGGAFTAKEHRLVRQERADSMHAASRFLREAMGRLQHEHREASAGDTASWFREFLYARGWAKRPLPVETPTDVANRAKTVFRRIASEWAESLHAGLLRERLETFLR